MERIGLEEGLPTARINAVSQGPHGFYWLASEGAGLLRFDGYDFETYGVSQFPVINQLIYDSLGQRLVFEDGSTLWTYEGQEFKPINTDLEGLEDLTNSAIGPIWLSAGALYNLQSDTVVALLKLKSESAGLISFGREMFLWDQDLYRLDFSASEIRKEFLADSLEFGLIYPNLDQALFARSSQGFSLGIYESGLRMLDGQKEIFQFKFPIGMPVPREAYLSNKGSIILLGDDAIYRIHGPWESSYPRQIPILSLAQNGKKIYLSTAMGLESLQSKFSKISLANTGLILDICSLGEELILGTERGLWSYNLQSAELKSLGLSGFVFSLMAQGDRVWVGASDGIWSYNKGAASAQLEFDAESLGGASIFKISADAEGAIWFASYANGVFKFEDGQIQKIEAIGNFNLDGISLSAFEVLHDRRLALATLNQGLFILDPKSEQNWHYDLRGIEFAEIRDLIEWKDQLWLGTNKGLLSLKDVQEKSKAIDQLQLHFRGGPVSSKGLKVQGDSLISAGDQGLYIWNLQALQEQSADASLALLKLDLLGQDSEELMDRAEGLQDFTSIPINLDLSYQQNYLRFGFSLATWFHPEWVQYRYRLIGQSADWTYAGASREALFTDLKSGNFNLEVQARYPWQDWQLQAEVYSFKIRSAFWRTWWFWTLMVAATGTLAYFWMRDRYRKREERLRLENDLMEMERKALRLQMNPHFIFNALDSISSFIFKKDPKQAVRYLNNFAKLMRLTLESSMEHVHPVETEVSILKNYLELEKLRFSEKFDYEIELDEEFDFDVGMPPMLIQPHVENAILHGLKPKGTKGYVRISFSREEDHLCCVIEDDGIGREKAKSLPGKKAHRSMATQINKDRIALLRKSVDEEIDLQVIDKYNQAGEAEGTKVIIRLPAQEL